VEAFAAKKRVLPFGPCNDSLQELLRDSGIGSVYSESSSLAGGIVDLVRHPERLAPAVNDEAIASYRAENVVAGVIKMLAG
jgi:hypothetical protein